MAAERPASPPSSPSIHSILIIASAWIEADNERASQYPFPLRSALYHEDFSTTAFNYLRRHPEEIRSTYVKTREARWIHGDQVTYWIAYIGATATLRSNGQWVIQIGDLIEYIGTSPPPPVFDISRLEYLLRSCGRDGAADQTPLHPQRVFRDLAAVFPSLRRVLRAWYQNQ